MLAKPRRWTRESRLDTFTKGEFGMTDTPSEIERMIREKFMALSGEVRFIMGAQMFESAKEMVNASLLLGLSETERRRELFRRIYGKETGIEKLIWV